MAELLRHPYAKLLAVIQAVPEEALDRVFNLLLNFTVATESYVKEIWSALFERGLERWWRMKRPGRLPRLLQKYVFPVVLLDSMTEPRRA
ncbi:hypothetical protein [Mesorhizobium sp. L2C066B000]|uniref:hypothetical protein n=1 Tax=Mesorhizobium sp. L2C066B000 TaxID=1287105 RepID=UPI0003CFC9CB|nr:hypothetical protein [Mesorhizobium sp. L2C066B000]ESZ31324.1 hypothetical protein X732_30420 [Mesorhizobium sp. L2C066B000]